MRTTIIGEGPRRDCARLWRRVWLVVAVLIFASSEEGKGKAWWMGGGRNMICWDGEPTERTKAGEEDANA